MKERKVPMRKCVGCTVSKEKQELVRIAGFEGALTLDLTGKAKGRGVYLCKNSPECWEKAEKRKAIDRSLKESYPQEEKAKIFAQLKEMAQNG